MSVDKGPIKFRASGDGPKLASSGPILSEPNQWITFGRLADTEAACLYTGRPRDVLYRWARERRITRYGSPERRLWDLDELPVHIPGRPLPEPPKRRVKGGS